MDQQTPGTQSEASRSPHPSYFPSTHHAPVSATSEPDLVKRFVAILIDGILVAVIAGVVGVVSGLLGAIAGLAAWLLRDVALQGRSPGKKLMGLNAVTVSGGPITVAESVKRNATLSLGYVSQVILAAVPLLGLVAAVPLWGLSLIVGLYECYLVITHKPRLGDTIAGTHVVAEGKPAVAV